MSVHLHERDKTVFGTVSVLYHGVNACRVINLICGDMNQLLF